MFNCATFPTSSSVKLGKRSSANIWEVALLRCKWEAWPGTVNAKKLLWLWLCFGYALASLPILSKPSLATSFLKVYSNASLSVMCGHNMYITKQCALSVVVAICAHWVLQQDVCQSINALRLQKILVKDSLKKLSFGALHFWCICMYMLAGINRGGYKHCCWATFCEVAIPLGIIFVSKQYWFLPTSFDGCVCCERCVSVLRVFLCCLSGKNNAMLCHVSSHKCRHYSTFIAGCTTKIW